MWSAARQAADEYSSAKADFSKIEKELQPRLVVLSDHLRRLQWNADKMVQCEQHYKISTVEDAAESLEAIREMLTEIARATDIVTTQVQNMQQQLDESHLQVNSALQALLQTLPIKDQSQPLDDEQNIAPVEFTSDMCPPDTLDFWESQYESYEEDVAKHEANCRRGLCLSQTSSDKEYLQDEQERIADFEAFTRVTIQKRQVLREDDSEEREEQLLKIEKDLAWKMHKLALRGIPVQNGSIVVDPRFADQEPNDSEGVWRRDEQPNIQITNGEDVPQVDNTTAIERGLFDNVDMHVPSAGKQIEDERPMTNAETQEVREHVMDWLSHNDDPLDEEVVPLSEEAKSDLPDNDNGTNQLAEVDFDDSVSCKAYPNGQKFSSYQELVRETRRDAWQFQLELDLDQAYGDLLGSDCEAERPPNFDDWIHNWRQYMV